MSDPTTPSDPAKPTASPESGAETAPPAPAPTPGAENTAPPAPAVPATTPPAFTPGAEKTAPTTPAPAVPPSTPLAPTAGAEKTGPMTDKPGATGDASAADKSAGAPAAGASAADKPAGAPGAEGAAADPAEGKDGEKKFRFWRRGPFVTVAGAVVVLVVLGLLGYVWGLGPLNRLNTNRGITPPAKLAGLDRITDPDIRGQLQLDQTKQALSRINNGKQATVEAYGNLDGDRLFVVIALRGKVDIAKTVADSGAAPDKVKKIGQATCVETTGNLPTQCYRGSNTLTVIAQSANEGITVDQVAPVAVEAFHAMK
ncbi:hypothetical protein ACIA49_00565 [Kribbella sp. NPDC051587]|uniref:hypothetical protein n=1 Tax=Kribbella sp. NPDC051587 TaxID=3364119 RepID=UPI0037A0B3AC